MLSEIEQVDASARSWAIEPGGALAPLHNLTIQVLFNPDGEILLQSNSRMLPLLRLRSSTRTPCGRLVKATDCLGEIWTLLLEGAAVSL
jgi:hypothetical protein